MVALAERQPRLLEAADTLLFMPDLFHYFLSGRAAPEFTIATTSQMYDGRRGDWARPLLDTLGLPARLLPPVVPPGEEYGSLLPHLASVTGAGPVPIVAPGGHDTACAVAAVPAESTDGWAYLSSGTWSLVGVEVNAPVVNAETEQANFTNEGGVENTFRLLKNIAGLWLVQECRRTLARGANGRDYGYDELTALAQAAPPLASVIDPDDPSLMAPADMPEAIRALCRTTGEPEPNEVGPLIRCALDGLVMRYRWTINTLERITGRPIHTLHIVGGGTQNTLLNQLAADATGRRVLAGPVEATAIGNVLLQAKARGRIGSLSDLREIVRASFPVREYIPDPDSRARYEAAYHERFLPRLPRDG
jgi:rhamnulokinase